MIRFVAADFGFALLPDSAQLMTVEGIYPPLVALPVGPVGHVLAQEEQEADAAPRARHHPRRVRDHSAEVTEVPARPHRGGDGLAALLYCGAEAARPTLAAVRRPATVKHDRGQGSRLVVGQRPGSSAT
jgi:hypothetical protein